MANLSRKRSEHRRQIFHFEISNFERRRPRASPAEDKDRINLGTHYT